MIVPTIGRIVWYHPFGPQKTVAAIICAVKSDHVVNLTYFGEWGGAFSAIDVPLIQDGETPPASGTYAEWMPYQKGQAAKTEQLEKLAHTHAPTIGTTVAGRE